LSTGVGDICEKVEYVSENVESNETTEAALERIGFVVTPGGHQVKVTWRGLLRGESLKTALKAEALKIHACQE